MPVLIHGKEYATVNERLKLAHENNKALSITTELLTAPDGDRVVVRALITTDKGTFTGIAQEDKRNVGISGENPFEVAETSAVGRALAFAGYLGTQGDIGTVASAEELESKLKSKAEPIKKVTLEDVKSVFEEKEKPITCKKCDAIIAGQNNFTAKQIAGYSKKKFGKELCLKCQRESDV